MPKSISCIKKLGILRFICDFLFSPHPLMTCELVCLQLPAGAHRHPAQPHEAMRASRAHPSGPQHPGGTHIPRPGLSSL